MLPTVLLVLLVGSAQSTAQPWYQRPDCVEATRKAFSGDLTGATRHTKALLTGDLDAKACAVWLESSIAELRVGIEGRTDRSLGARRDKLRRLFAFARRHGRRAPRFGDLEVEARSRRVRVLMDEGERTAAVEEARRVQRMLESRPTHWPSTATHEFVRGGLDLAVGSAPWPLRAVLALVGIQGDAADGKRTFERLWAGPTVYRFDALNSARHFADEDEDGPLGDAIQYSGQLRRLFPNNPQFVFDNGDDLRRNGRCRDALTFVVPAVRSATVSQSAPMRARLHWLRGRCSLDIGDRSAARESAAAARKVGYTAIEDRLSALERDL